MTGTVSPVSPRRWQPSFVRLFLLAAAFAMLLSTRPTLSLADNIAGEGVSDKVDDKKDENGKDQEKNGDKEKNGKDKDKDKKEEIKKILQLVAEGKMTAEQALTKLAEKKDDDKDKEDKDKEEDKFKLLPQGWNFHAQTTIIPNFQPGFGALYSGPNSLHTEPDRRGTITSDLFLGVPLWHGAEFQVVSLQY